MHGGGHALAAGWADLLAEVAGILEGTSEGEPDESIAGWPPGCAARPGPRSEGDPDPNPGGQPPLGERQTPAVLRYGMSVGWSSPADAAPLLRQCPQCPGPLHL